MVRSDLPDRTMRNVVHIGPKPCSLRTLAKISEKCIKMDEIIYIVIKLRDKSEKNAG